MSVLREGAEAAPDVAADPDLAVGVREQQLLGGNLAQQIVECVAVAVAHEIGDLDRVHREHERSRCAVRREGTHRPDDIRDSGPGAAEGLGDERREEPAALQLLDSLEGKARVTVDVICERRGYLFADRPGNGCERSGGSGGSAQSVE